MRFVGHPHAPKTLLLFLGHGYLAVSLFFILSGFVLTYNYGELSSRTPFFTFIRARLARLYPVYALALLLQLPIYWASATLGKTLAVVFLVQSWTVTPSEFPSAWNYPAWTLSIEMFFYLCFPFLLQSLRKIRSKTSALWITCLISLAVSGAQAACAGRLSWFTTHVPLPLLRLPEFCLGMLLVDYSPKKSFAGRLPMIVCITAIALLLALNLHRFVTLIIVPFAALIWLLANRPGLLQRTLGSKPMVLLGGSSYAIYLLQEPLRRLFAIWIGAQFGIFTSSLIYLVGLTLTGIIVFLLFEEPVRHWIRHAIDASGRVTHVEPDHHKQVALAQKREPYPQQLPRA
jgi:peptidoglycan/LPS O-acetylase OafA/YrhL